MVPEWIKLAIAAICLATLDSIGVFGLGLRYAVPYKDYRNRTRKRNTASAYVKDHSYSGVSDHTTELQVDSALRNVAKRMGKMT